MYDLAFTIDAQDTTTPLTLPIDQAVIAGFVERVNAVRAEVGGVRVLAELLIDGDFLDRQIHAQDFCDVLIENTALDDIRTGGEIYLADGGAVVETTLGHQP